MFLRALFGHLIAGKPPSEWCFREKKNCGKMVQEGRIITNIGSPRRMSAVEPKNSINVEKILALVNPIESFKFVEMGRKGKSQREA